MGRPKGSKNKKTLLLDKLAEATPDSSVVSGDSKSEVYAFDDLVEDKPSNFKVTDEFVLAWGTVHDIPNEKPIESLLTTSPVEKDFESLAGDTLERVSTTDSKANPQGKYYQFMHPCHIENPPFFYRFISVIKNGVSYSTLPFEDREECHKLLKQLIETDIVPVHPNIYIN